MTDDPNSPAEAGTQPIPPELIDELCSADLDGELEAACADHDIDLAAARAAIAAHAARRETLAAAGRSVGALDGGDRLDEFTRARMSRDAVSRTARGGRGAMSSSGGRRATTSAIAGIAGIAAAVLLAVVVVAATRHGGGSESSSKSAGTEAPQAARSAPTTIDLGAITGGPDLAQRLGVLRGGSSLAESAPTSKAVPHSTVAVDAGGGGGTQSSGATGTSVYSAAEPPTTPGSFDALAPDGSARSAAPGHCLPGLPFPTGARDVQIVARASLHGEPLVVARGVLGSNRVALVAFRAADCRVFVFFTGE